MDGKKIFNEKQAAEYLCVSVSIIRTWCKPTFKKINGFGLIKKYRAGVAYFTKEDLDKFLEKKLQSFKNKGSLKSYLDKLKEKGTVE